MESGDITPYLQLVEGRLNGQSVADGSSTLRVQRLPSDGDYFVKVTSDRQGAQFGHYTLSIDHC